MLVGRQLLKKLASWLQQAIDLEGHEAAAHSDLLQVTEQGVLHLHMLSADFELSCMPSPGCISPKCCAVLVSLLWHTSR